MTRLKRRVAAFESSVVDQARHDSSDGAVRHLLHNLAYLSELQDAVRRQIAAEIELTLPQFNVLMTIRQQAGATGVSVGDVAEALHVTGAFVTTETNRLAAKRLVLKMPNPSDGRSTLLKPSSYAEDRIAAVADRLRHYNARFFGLIDKDALAALGASLAKLVRGGESALLELSAPRAVDLVGRRNSSR
jgi:MarR family transcriptional regulator, organic hydroperoxide resistance regulator